jgi:hypothetical protein
MVDYNEDMTWRERAAMKPSKTDILRAKALLVRAADLAQSIHEDDRETGWCENVERDVREALRLLS